MNHSPDARLCRALSKLMQRYTLSTVLETAWDIERARFAARIEAERNSPTERNRKLARAIIRRREERLTQ